MNRRDPFEVPLQLLLPHLLQPEVADCLCVVRYFWGPAGPVQEWREVVMKPSSGPKTVGAGVFRTVSAVRSEDGTWFGGGVIAWGSCRTTEKEADREQARQRLADEARDACNTDYARLVRNVGRAVGRKLRARVG